MLTMEEAMKQSYTRFAAGEIVKGTIIEVRPKEVLVDIGYKSEGVISGGEFIDAKALKVGDEIDVLIEKLEDKEGMVVLSHEKAEFKKNWERILTICNEGGTINGKVKAVVKGGLLVNIGVEAFLPASQIDITTPKNLQQYVNNSYDFKVVKINQERQNIVLSPSELLKGGQDIDVVVLDINREKERVSLGLKQKMTNPWDKIETKYPIGADISGKVVNLVPYG